MKYELKRRHIGFIMSRYGTYNAYKGEFIEDGKTYNKVEFLRKDKTGMLTINLNTDMDDESTYVMVHLINSYGNIIRKDRYGFFADGMNLYFDCFQNLIDDSEGIEFIPFDFENKEIQHPKRHTRDNTVQSLRKELSQYKEAARRLSSENKKLKEEKEELFNTLEEKNKVITELKEKESCVPPRTQEIFNQTVKARDFYKESFEKESKKCKELKEEIENLKLKLSAMNISDEELESLCGTDIRDKASEILNGTDWTSGYQTMEKGELIKRLRYSESISFKRKETITKLKKELNSKKYDKYIPEDAVNYNEIVLKLKEANRIQEQYAEGLNAANEDRDRMRAEIERLTAGSGEVDGLQIIKENIKKDKEIRDAMKKKPGRKAKFDESKIALMIELKNQGCSMRDIAREIGCSAATVCQKIKQYGE